MNTRIRGGNAIDGQFLAAACSLAPKTFRQADIPAIRHFASLFGARAGMGAPRLADFMLAVSEAAACATSHGPCTARLRLWTTEFRTMCEVRGDGALLRREPDPARRGELPDGRDIRLAERLRREGSRCGQQLSVARFPAAHLGLHGHLSCPRRGRPAAAALR